MIITALYTFDGTIDLSANQKLQDLNELEALPFRLAMVPGQVATVDDKFYYLRSIQSALSDGLIHIVISSIIHNFTDLNDVSNSYTGQNDKLLKVKSNETGIEFGL